MKDGWLRWARTRRGCVALIACVAVVALASCGKDAERSEATGEVTASGDVGVFDVRVGDCLGELPGDLDAAPRR